MPPKRANTGVSKRGRGRATRGRGNAHGRVLNDIVEESEGQSSSSAALGARAPPAGPRANTSKKRTLDEAQIEPDAISIASSNQRDINHSASKRAKTALDPTPADETVQSSSDLPVTAEDAAPYVPTPALLYFITLGHLDTSPSTEHHPRTSKAHPQARELAHRALRNAAASRLLPGSKPAHAPTESGGRCRRVGRNVRD